MKQCQLEEVNCCARFGFQPFSCVLFLSVAVDVIFYASNLAGIKCFKIYGCNELNNGSDGQCRIRTLLISIECWIDGLLFQKHWNVSKKLFRKENKELRLQ